MSRPDDVGCVETAASLRDGLRDRVGELEARVATLEAEREALYRLAWKWGIDRDEGTYHPDNPPPEYGEWARKMIRQAAGIDPYPADPLGFDGERPGDTNELF